MSSLQGRILLGCGLAAPPWAPQPQGAAPRSGQGRGARGASSRGCRGCWWGKERARLVTAVMVKDSPAEALPWEFVE